MSDRTATATDLTAQIAALTAMMQQAQAAQPAQSAQPMQSVTGFGGWGKPPVPQVQAAQPNGILIPIGLETSIGNVTVHLEFGPEFAVPEKLLALLETLIINGVPIKGWQKQGQGWGGKRGGWGR